MTYQIPVTRTTNPKPRPEDESKLGFARYFTDHMFVMEYDEGKGWHSWRVEPHAPFLIEPASAVLHYAQMMFEGMKAYRKPDGSWIRDLLPIPADIMQTAALESGKALLGMPSRYFVGLGVYGKKGTIVQDDSIRFFEDERAYKTKLQGNARPLDEYAWVLLDIANLKTELPVLVKDQAA